MNRICIALIVALLGLPALGQAPRGWRTFDHAQTGLRWYYPKEFDITPVDPNESLILARFQRPSPFRPKMGKGQRNPEQFITFRLTAKPEKEEQAQGATVSGDKKEELKSYEEMVERHNAIYEWKTFMKRRFPGHSWNPMGGKIDDDGQLSRLVVRGEYVGFLFVKEIEGETWGVVGYCDDAVAKYFEKIYANVGKTFHVPEGYKAVKTVDESYYEGKDFRDIEFRVKARQAMVKGWKALDTENFFVVYHTKNVKLVNKIVNDLEAIRPHYEEMFPPVKPIESVSVVRVCESRDEYHAYGGRPGTAGYWNFVARELVLYDSDRAAADSFVVLYHEAFHQYIFYALDELSPDYWFNEGMADYFAGAEFYRHSTKLKGIDLNSWRIHSAKILVDHERFVPLKPLINAKRAQFYAEGAAGIMYAEAWSFCYFLLRAKETEERQEWRSIIPRYYAALKEEKAKLEKLMTADSTLDEKNKIQDRMRDGAMKTAFEGIKLEELQEAWRQWLRDVKNPFEGKR